MIGSNIIWRYAGQQGQRDSHRFRGEHKHGKRKGGWSSNSQDARTLCGSSGFQEWISLCILLDEEWIILSFSACLSILALSELGTSRLYFWSSDHLRNLCIIVRQYLCNVIPNSPDQVMQNKNLLRELPYFGHNIILCAMGNSTTSSRLIISQLKSIWNVSLAFMTFIPFSFNSYAALTPFRPIRAYVNL